MKVIFIVHVRQVRIRYSNQIAPPIIGIRGRIPHLVCVESYLVELVIRPPLYVVLRINRLYKITVLIILVAVHISNLVDVFYHIVVLIILHFYKTVIPVLYLCGQIQVVVVMPLYNP
ncbi:hypothetical protein ES703_123619 [subsurface metagenome]